MTELKDRGPARIWISRIMVLLLLVFLAALFALNNAMVESAYKHVNQNSDNNLVFTGISENEVYKILHFASPVNVTNISLWGVECRSDALYFALFTSMFIALSLGVVIKIKPISLFQLPVIVFIPLLSMPFLNGEGLTFLLAINVGCYGVAICLLIHGIRNRRMGASLLGLVFWLIPNTYQLIFLEGIYL